MPESEIVVLRAVPQDFDLARQAIAEVNLPTSHHPVPVDDAALTAFLADPKLYLLLAVQERKVAGSLYGYALQSPYRKQPQLFLYGIDVRPEFSGHGIGTSLVSRFIDEARLAGACEVWVITDEANAAAMKIYTRCAMKRTGTGDVVLTLALDVQRSSDPTPPLH